MGNRGRFGKYGDSKRIERLRKSRIGTGHAQGRGVVAPGGAAHYKKRAPEGDRFTTRPARASDVDYVRGLSKKVFQQYGPYENMLPRWLESGVTVTVIALMGKRTVGFAMVGRLRREWSHPAVSELLAIAVEPEARRLGIGDLLMREVVKRAKELKVETLALYTGVENLPGQRLFKKHGFIPSEVKKNFYPGGQDAIMMYKDIL